MCIMRKKCCRLLSVVLVIVCIVALAVPASAASYQERGSIRTSGCYRHGYVFQNNTPDYLVVKITSKSGCSIWRGQNAVWYGALFGSDFKIGPYECATIYVTPYLWRTANVSYTITNIYGGQVSCSMWCK